MLLRQKIKLAIVNAIRRNGEVSGVWLCRLIWGVDWTPSLKSHVWQLRRQGYPIHAVQVQQRQWVYRYGKRELLRDGAGLMIPNDRFRRPKTATERSRERRERGKRK
jgi:hypothetical protein